MVGLLFPPTCRHVARMCARLAMLVFASTVWAVERVPIDSADSLVVEQLIRTYDLHIEAAAELIEAIDLAKRPPTGTLTTLTHRWRQATVAWADYTWTDRGHISHRTYHAISGPGAAALLGVDPGNSMVPQAGTSWRIARPERDARSVLDVGEIVRANDAEVKLMRSIEADILDGKVRADGRARLWVSQRSCDSCFDLARQFESAYGGRVTLYELPRASKADVSAAFSVLDAHRKNGLRRLRDGIATTQARKSARGRSLLAPCLP